jgi:hypothetical protein
MKLLNRFFPILHKMKLEINTYIEDCPFVHKGTGRILQDISNWLFFLDLPRSCCQAG